MRRAREHLRLINRSLSRLRRRGLAGQHAEATLETLARLLGPTGFSPQHRYTLREILDETREAMPEVERNRRIARRMHRLCGFAAK